MAHRWNFDSEFCNEKLADLPGGSPERLKGRTQMKLKSSRGIVMKLICCMALAVVVSVAALAQVGPGPRSGSFPPKSGAMLEIQGTVGSTPIDLKLYDSQIHSGSVMPVPLGNASTNTSNCNGNDQIPTDAYVLQGGAPTGCDPGDPYEVTENNAGTHQASGLKSETKFSGFHIDTHYLSEPIVSITAASQSDTTTTYTYSVTRGADLVSGETIVVSGYTGTDVGNNGTFPSISVGSGTFSVTNASGVNSGQSATGTVSNAVCNHDLSICASPDTGFLTVTNNTHSSFSGTISLKGTSPGCGSVSDSYSAGLDDGG